MTVQEAIARSKTTNFMVKGSVKAAQKMISSSEEIIWALVSNVYTIPVRGELRIEPLSSDMLCGVIVVTDQRILFVHSLLGRGTAKEIRLSNIRSIDSKVSDVYECLRIMGTSDMIVTTSARNIISDFRNAINEALDRRETRTQSHLPANSDTLDASDIQQLQALKQLYDSGVITAEEFAAKKAQILNL